MLNIKFDIWDKFTTKFYSINGISKITKELTNVFKNYLKFTRTTEKGVAMWKVFHAIILSNKRMPLKSPHLETNNTLTEQK